MEAIAKGWFTELSPEERENFGKEEGEEGKGKWKLNGAEKGQAWPGQAFSLKVVKVLHQSRSKFQDVLVFQSTDYGNVLVLDGVIQCTERDEFAYQELLAHLPLFAHPQPKKVLIIGGGDGGILREVLKHPSVDSVTMCEIDAEVVEVSKKYLPKMAAGFADPRLSLHIGDGLAFLASSKEVFDVIITDSSDPLGPAESLFGEAYYKLLKSHLSKNGVLASQGESIWLHLDLIREMVHFCRGLFPSVAFAHGSVPSYPSGGIGFLLASNDEGNLLEEPVREVSPEMELNYYSARVHRAAFALPTFAAKALA